MKYIQPNWPAPTSVKVYTTTRLGWQAPLFYQADKLTETDESKRLQTLLNIPSEPIWLKQTHSNTPVEAISENRGIIADASFATQPNQVCVVFTADCLPLLICNRSGTHVAAVHAGWRGLASGIIENTIKSLNQPSNDLLVWLGPAIGPTKFEVGKDVYDAFTSRHAEADKAFIPINEGKWLANLYQLATLRLQLLGITEIYGGDHCTHLQNDLFYSYRRDKGQTGRMANLIWIQNN